MEALIFYGGLGVGLVGGGFLAGVAVTERYLREHPGRWDPQRRVLHKLGEVVRMQPRAS